MKAEIKLKIHFSLGISADANSSSLWNCPSRSRVVARAQKVKQFVISQFASSRAVSYVESYCD